MSSLGSAVLATRCLCWQRRDIRRSRSHLVTGQQKYGTQLLGPVACDGSCQGIAAEGFEINAFAVNWDKQKVMCPLGKESVLFRRVKNARVSWFFCIKFALSDCQSCESRSQCTRCVKTGRSLYLHPQGEHEALHERRLYQKTKEFAERYKARSGIEGTLSKSVRMHGLRRFPPWTTSRAGRRIRARRGSPAMPLQQPACLCL